MLSIKKYKPKLFPLFTTFCVSAGKAYEIESDTEFCIISSQIFPMLTNFSKRSSPIPFNLRKIDCSKPPDIDFLL